MNYKNIKNLADIIDRSIHTINPPLDYARTTTAIISLCDAINAYEGDTEELWWMELGDSSSLDNLIVGAYWHYTEWHGGQESQEYAALCALGSTSSQQPR